MMKVPVVVFSGYDPNDATNRLCRENWRIYADYFPNIHFVVNCVDSKLSYGSYALTNGDLRIGYREIIGEGNAEPPYEQWTPSNWAMGVKRSIAALSYLFETFTEPFWCAWSNITGFICFDRLVRVLDRLECKNVYAGTPIFFAPEQFIYIGGSHTLYSSDTLKKVLLFLISNPPLPECSDITAGRPLKDSQKLMIPIGNFLSHDFPNDQSLISKIKLAEDYVRNGQFMFRFKNVYASIPREFIDPYLQSAVMLLCRSTPVNDQMLFSAIRDYGQKVQRGEGITCVGNFSRV